MQILYKNRFVFVVSAKDFDAHHFNVFWFLTFTYRAPLCSRVDRKVSCHQSVYTSRAKEIVATSGAIDVTVITQKADLNIDCSIRIAI